MIDEARLIDELKQSGMIADNEHGNAMLDMINGQPKIGDWITCSERLPKKSGEYIVMISGAELPTCLNFLSSDNSWFDMEKDYEVSYWQPLPEAYHG